MRDVRFKAIHPDENTFWAIGNSISNFKLILLCTGLLYISFIHAVALVLLVERMW